MSAKRKSKRTTRIGKPKQVSVTMYDVGFGDCFLVTFLYRNNVKRRILIDCGSTSKRKPHMSRVVDQLIADCEGHVDAVVATHRHKDHISAFGLKGIDTKLKSLKPDIVIQPWTEDPDAEKNALKPTHVLSAKALGHIKGLHAAQDFAAYLTENATRILAAAAPSTRTQLSKIASLSIPNKKAILCLNSMSPKRAYVHAGSRSGLERLLPGVKVHVLGPPTLEQTETIRRQTSWNEDEFWKLHAKLAAASGSNVSTARASSLAFPKESTTAIARAPSYVRWVIERLDRQQLQYAKRIVRSLDDALNNTSVVLLFEVGAKALLFPGDAQLENWQFALEKSGNRALLRNTALYKVGHHGSTNATPKSLWNLFRYKGRSRQRLVSLLSTEPGHHNRVPRRSLVNALDSDTVLESTQRWHRKLSETYIL